MASSVIPTLRAQSLEALQKVITGDSQLSPYRSGPRIIEFFNLVLGTDDSYSWSGGTPSRWYIAQQRLEPINGTRQIVDVIEAAVHPTVFLDSKLEVTTAVEHLNKYLEYDGYELVSSGEGTRKKYRLRQRGEALVGVEAQLNPAQHVSHEYIAEQIEKCEIKLRDSDYDGAITNARSLVEAVLSDIETRLAPAPGPFNGEVSDQFKRVQKLLSLEPDQPNIENSLRSVLKGLSSIVAGISAVRNAMGDAHVRKYKPARRHAKLVVNAARTFADFIYETFEHQLSSGRIVEVTRVDPTP